MAQSTPLSHQALINESMIEALVAQGFKVEYPKAPVPKGQVFANYASSIKIPESLYPSLVGFVSEGVYVVTGEYVTSAQSDGYLETETDTCCMTAKVLYAYILDAMFNGTVGSVKVKMKGGNHLEVSIENDCVIIRDGAAVYGYVGYKATK